jgi:hypothetical protein
MNMLDIRTHKKAFVRLIAAILAALAIAVFVHLYSLLQANFLQYGHKMRMNILPLPTRFYLLYSAFGYLLPLVLAFGLFIKNVDQERQCVRMEILLKIVGLVALVWLLGCLLAWQLPLYVPVAVIS